jgi:hypothetical protein
MESSVFSLIVYDSKNAIIVGSQKDENAIYKNDTDIQETISTHGSIEKLTTHFHKVIKSILKKLEQNKDIYFMEFKGGIYKPMYLSDDKILNNASRKSFYESKLAEGTINNQLLDIINSCDKNDLLDFCTNLYKVRWSAKDIKKGKVVLFNGEDFYFKDLFQSKSVIKLDIMFFDGERFEEFSNMFDIVNNNRSMTTESEDYLQSMKNDIKMFVKDGNYFKAVKRLYSVAKHEKETRTIANSLMIINGKPGELYRLRGLVANIQLVLEHHSSKPVLEKSKIALQYVYGHAVLSTRTRNMVLKCIKSRTRKTFVKLLGNIIENINIQSQNETKKLITKYKITV